MAMNDPFASLDTSSIPITHLMPIKNGMAYFPAVLEDLIANVREYDEILLIDDGSTDGTREYLENYFLGREGVLIVEGPKSGLVNALNMGFSLSSNNWIARYDVDDRYSKNRIQNQSLHINENVAVIFSDYQVIDGGGHKLGLITSGVTSFGTEISLIYSQQTAHPSALINKLKYIESGKYRQEEYPAEDLGLWIRMYKFGQLISSPRELLSYRITATGISQSNKISQMTMRKKLIDEFAANYKFDFERMKETLKEYRDIDDSSVRRILLFRNCLKMAIIKHEIFLILKIIIIGFSYFKLSDTRVLLSLVFQKVKRTITK